ncbi:MAG TPA: sugar transferase [Candidatus Paceibacterota bacterium]|nr:sugar transferase [Candidatus Paceibacterota bacterium]
MTLVGKKDAIFLLLGDILSLILALWVALFIRYQQVPDLTSFETNFFAFLPVFGFWMLSFFIFGFYDKQTTALKKSLPTAIFNVSVINGFVALTFFYLFAFPEVTPKTNLLLCLIFSTAFVIFIRTNIFDLVRSSKIGNVILVGDSDEIREIGEEILKNKNYGMNPIVLNNLDENIFQFARDNKSGSIIVNLRCGGNNKNSAIIYRLLSSDFNIIDAERVYESLFDKISLSCVNDEWFLENNPDRPRFLYDFIKRSFDLVTSFILAIFSLIFYPFVYLAIKLDDGGPVFLYQERVGKNGRLVNIIKFRTMSVSDEGKWVVKNDPRITRVGGFLRKSRIDELPQLWNVLRGDVSLVGPRPELPKLVDLYEKEIPYYSMRHLVKPGLSGWAQIHHEKPPHSIEETREKLAYDLYYIKNRSLALELEIALKTIKTLLSRSGV